MSDGEADICFEPPDFLYVAETVQFPSLPAWLPNIGAVALSDEAVFFTAWGEKPDEEQINIYSLFTMNYDGSGLKELPNHTAESFPFGIDHGSASINLLYIDNKSNLWTVESGSYSVSNGLSINDPNNITNIRKIRKMTVTGEELMSIDISNLTGSDVQVSIIAISTDSLGNIYLASYSNIYIFNSRGDLLFNLDLQNPIRQFIRTSDGAVAFISHQQGTTMLTKIDVSIRGWGDRLKLPDNVYNIFNGNSDFFVFYNQGTNLYGIAAETNETVHILNWLDSGVAADRVSELVFISDERIIACMLMQADAAGSRKTELVYMIKTPYTMLPEKTVLTLGTLRTGHIIEDAIIIFNRKSSSHRIHVIDYSIYNIAEDTTAGYNRFITEITAGRIPDIIDLTNMPFNNLVANNILVDLYPLLDIDPTLSRSDILDAVLREAETGDKLYRIIPGFSISTLIGHALILGNDPGWTMEEFTAIIEANPQADIPLGSRLSDQYFLYHMFIHNIYEYVDYEAGTVNFNSYNFIELLKMAKIFTVDEQYNRYELILSDRQIMAGVSISDFNNYKFDRAIFKGNVVFKGFPTQNKNGHALVPHGSIAITKTCNEKDEAWNFIRTLLTESYQREHLYSCLPVNRAVFEENIAASMISQSNISLNYVAGYGEVKIPILPLSSSEAKMIEKLIDNTFIIPEHEHMWNIIKECATDYFNDKLSIYDAVRIIQNRASIYMSEQAG